MSRQKLIHLHGVNTPAAASTLTDKGFVAGEIAVKNAVEAKDSELYVLGGDNKLAVFGTKDWANDAIADAIKTASDTLSGDVTAVSNAVADLASVVSTFSGNVTTQFTTVNGEIDAIEDVLGDADKGLVKKVNDIEATHKTNKEAIDGRLGALEASAHTHDNKTVLDGITEAQVTAWDAAEQNAKDYADEKVLAESSARTDAIKVVDDKVIELSGTVASNKTELEGKIAEAKAAATTKVVEGTDAGENLSITSATDESTSAVTYTINLTDVASASKLQGVDEDLKTLIGNDKDMSARGIVQDEVAKQLTSSAITESFDTLKEMAEWLSSHPDDVQEMNDAISANTTAITAEATARQEADNELKSKIEAVETKVTGATAEAIEGLKTRMTTAEGDIDALEGRMNTAESDITANTAAITAEVTARETAITGVENAYKAADDVLVASIASARTDFAAADTQIRNDFASADTQIRNDFAAADATVLSTATGYTDAQITALTNGAIKELGESLAEVKETADGAVQTVTVSNLQGVTAARSGAAVTIDYKEMIIDCGSWE